jgi:carboxylesterase
MTDPEGVGEWGRSILLTHGRPTAKVFVLLHGLTASPLQFAEFGRLLFARGSNVLIPRLPRHGDADRMTAALGQLDAAELVSFADSIVAEARAYGERVVVVGFSIGGLLAAWIAQHHHVARVVAISPFLGLIWLPERFGPAVTDLALRLPNWFMWWHPVTRERLEPRHGYPRFPSHAIARIYRLARRLAEDARSTRPLTDDIVVVVNDSEVAIKNRNIVRLAASWLAHDGTHVTTHHLRGLPPSHDIIEPMRVPGIVARIYPELIALADS